jgi:hypothetical protein
MSNIDYLHLRLLLHWIALGLIQELVQDWEILRVLG